MNLKYDELLSIFAFNFNLRRYMEAMLEAEQRRERGAKITAMRSGGGTVHAPLIKKWNDNKVKRAALTAFEAAFAGAAPAGEGGAAPHPANDRILAKVGRCRLRAPRFNPG